MTESASASVVLVVWSRPRLEVLGGRLSFKAIGNRNLLDERD